MSTPFAERIADGRVHVFDGAMGTVLYGQGVFVNVCYDALVLDAPDRVRRVHRAYVEAGAEIVETNTFGANPVKLSAHGLAERTREINRAAAQLATEAAQGRASVVGSIGPLGIRIEPWGPTSTSEAADHFRPQVEGLLEGGVEGFVLETFADIHELEAAYRAVRRACDLPVVAQMTVGDEGRSVYGTGAAQLARELDALGVDVAGLNCSVGPAAMLEAVEAMAEEIERPLSAQPNAGLPRTVGDRKIYLASPEYMARYARRLIEAGARFVGGCCGTTPEHVRHLANTVASLQPRHASVAVRAHREGPAQHDVARPPPLEERSTLGRHLAEGTFTTTVELLPPHGWDASRLCEQARTASGAGVLTVSLVDRARGRSRMAALPAGMLVQRETGVEVVVHYTCRDRNMMGMLCDILGAAAGGVRNVLLVSGDPPVQGPYPDSTAVFDIDSIGLTNLVSGLNHGVDPGGSAIHGGATRFVIGVAANPGAVDMEREVERFMWKARAGADFAVTQPIFDVDALERFVERTRAWPLPLIGGAWPMRSLREAEFLANEVPGVVVPKDTVDRMRAAQARGVEFARAEGISIAREALEAARPLLSGAHVSAPGGDVRAALEVLDGVLPAPPGGG